MLRFVVVQQLVLEVVAAHQFSRPLFAAAERSRQIRSDRVLLVEEDSLPPMTKILSPTMAAPKKARVLGISMVAGRDVHFWVLES